MKLQGEIMIYDCFPFSDEFELLEIRLNHHSQFVDKFVLSEAAFTYSGIPKPLHYNEIKDKKPFAQFKDRIIHRVFSRPPNEGEKNWDYEYCQRNFLAEMIPEFTDDDLIIYLDCAEIIRDKSVVEEALKVNEIVCLDQKLCWYYFNVSLNLDRRSSLITAWKPVLLVAGTWERYAGRNTLNCLRRTSTGCGSGTFGSRKNSTQSIMLAGISATSALRRLLLRSCCDGFKYFP
jgi:hypothetical protein